jgi:hypothetical protein
MKRTITSLLGLAAFTMGMAQTTVTFNYTGAAQTFTVPPCVTSITVDVWGAKAGNNGSYAGGNGGRVQATVPVTPGEVLQIMAGQQGVNTSTNNPPVFNGGGGVYSYVSAGTAGTGGGASDIRRTPYGNADRLVVSGGGGGGGYTNVGGHGGGLIGQDGVPYPSWPNSGGKGGTQSAGGAAGVACCSCPTYTTAGAIAQGGNGAGDGAGGGGGGGGYFGGGGSCFAGGGGGSSYTAPGVTGVTHTQGYNTGAGQVIITYTPSGGVPPQPGNITGAFSSCSGDTIAFTVAPVMNATSYTWTVPLGWVIMSGQGTNSIVAIMGTNSGTISVTADNSCGSSQPSNVFISITPLPSLSISTSGDTICNGAQATLTANGANSYVWNPGNLTGSTIVVSPSTTTTYTVTGTTNGCSSTQTVTVVVNPTPTVSLGANVTQCGGTVLLDAGNVGNTYLWSTGATTQTITVSVSGSYVATVTNSFNCSASDTVDVTINPLPNVVAGGVPPAVCVDDVNITLTGSPAGGTWSGAGVTGNTFDPSAAGSGTHDLIYNYTDGNGCSGADTVSITVNLCLGITDGSRGTALVVYPNPGSDLVTLVVKGASAQMQITITDVEGRVVYTGTEKATTNGFVHPINTSTFAAGVYYMQLKTATEQRTEKIAIKR